MTAKAKVNPIPKGYATATAYLFIKGAEKALEFYKKAFGATEICRMTSPDKKIVHAEIKIGNSPIMLADACSEMHTMSPEDLKGSPVGIHLYVENVDAFVERATKAGAKLLQPIKDQFYGDRSCSLQDPFGHRWSVASRIEDVSEQEMNKRFEALSKQKHKSQCC